MLAISVDYCNELFAKNPREKVIKKRIASITITLAIVNVFLSFFPKLTRNMTSLLCQKFSDIGQFWDELRANENRGKLFMRQFNKCEKINFARITITQAVENVCNFF